MRLELSKYYSNREAMDRMRLFSPRTLDRVFGYILPEGDCWKWDGPIRLIKGKPYPVITVRAMLFSVRAYIVAFSNGAWPNKVVRTTCNQPMCVNISHLTMKTTQVEPKVQRELSDDVVLYIRSLYAGGWSIPNIAEDIELKQLHIYNIVKRRSYKDVE